MRSNIQVTGRRTGKSTRGFSTCIAQWDEAAFYEDLNPLGGWSAGEMVSFAFKDKSAHTISVALADFVYNECNIEGFCRKWLRESKQNRLFNLVKEVVHEH